jgi:hypothetical protein
MKSGSNVFNLLNAELNSICLLLPFLGAHNITHVSSIRFNNHVGGGGGLGEYGVEWNPKCLFRSPIFLDIKLHVKGIGFDSVMRCN